MRRSLVASSMILAVVFGVAPAGPASAQTGASPEKQVVPPAPLPGRNVSATGRVMPPSAGRGAGTDGTSNSNVAADMMKAQKAAAAREKAWDSKMRRTMGSICSGC